MSSISSPGRGYSLYRDDPVKDFRSTVLQPLDAAIGAQNDFYLLLGALGADVNASPRHPFRWSWSRPVKYSLLDHADQAITKLTEIINTKLPSLLIVTEHDTSTWAEEFDRLMEVDAREHSIRERDSLSKTLEDSQAQAQETREYFRRVRSFLVEQGGKPWDMIFPDEANAPKERKQTNSGSNHSAVKAPKLVKMLEGRTSSTDLVGGHTIVRYKQLFEACWSGDNDAIQMLCLSPGLGRKTVDTPLQITVKMKSNTKYSSRGEPQVLSSAGAQMNIIRFSTRVLALGCCDRRPEVGYSPPHPCDCYSTVSGTGEETGGI